jgi:hypothetical protein
LANLNGIAQAAGMHQHRDGGCLRHQLAQELEPFRPEHGREKGHAGYIRVGPSETFDKAAGYRIAARREHYGNAAGRALRGLGRSIAAGCNQHGDLPAHQLRRQGRQQIGASFRPLELNRNVLAFDVASFCQSLAEGRDHVRACLGRPAK